MKLTKLTIEAGDEGVSFARIDLPTRQRKGPTVNMPPGMVMEVTMLPDEGLALKDTEKR